MKYLINKLAEKIVGKRNLPPNVIPIDQPVEFNYWCPICQNPQLKKDNPNEFDDRLDWSEYEGFLWCRVCNLDIPTCFCVRDLNKKGRKRGTKFYEKSGLKDAIKIYLACIKDAKEK